MLPKRKSSHIPTCTPCSSCFTFWLVYSFFDCHVYFWLSCSQRRQSKLTVSFYGTISIIIKKAVKPKIRTCTSPEADVTSVSWKVNKNIIFTLHFSTVLLTAQTEKTYFRFKNRHLDHLRIQCMALYVKEIPS